MTIIFKTELLERKDIVTGTIKALKLKLKSFPEGKITIRHHNTASYYYLQSKDGQKYLNKSYSKLIGELIQKEYLQNVLETLEQEVLFLETALSHYPILTAEEVFATLPYDRQAYAKPITLSDEQFVERWLSQPYKRKPISSEAPAFITMKGDKVRSKSEMIIADRLWINGIPYKYECPLKIGNKVIHPDFTILRISDRKTLYHEHCGMMDNQEYSDDFVNRINLYASTKITIGDNLFLTFETAAAPLNTSLLDELINKNFR